MLLKIVPLAVAFVVVVLAEEEFDFDLSQFGEGLYERKQSEKQLVGPSDEDDEVNPEELGSFAEGDIYQPLVLKNSYKFKSKRWKNAVVPYEISEEFNIFDVLKIQEAFNTFKQKSCVRFVPRDSQRDYISIEGSWNGCWSTVGRAGGKQILNLQSSSCLKRAGTILHELMHVLGFFHEHTRYDRDRYVNVNMQNVKPDSVTNFKKDRQDRATTYGIGYDLGSVMHYSTMAFSRNGSPTIVPKIKYPEKIGQRNGFSTKDIQSINKMYCS
ncbi:hatching enzyme 1.2-like [Culex pipiens pallens]|uniref:hatching enzyme 1.2-like n=1 Tax=Culex pipiens pallens TaxID=42434 RepID=UPI0019548EA0|nr:hatching enzyme 1.2-like [Culex pipiens pallens]